MQVFLEMRLPRDMLVDPGWEATVERLAKVGFSLDQDFHPVSLSRMELTEELVLDETAIGLRGTVAERKLKQLQDLDGVLAVRSAPELRPVKQKHSFSLRRTKPWHPGKV